MNWTPIADRVVIKLSKEERTKTGIYIPSTMTTDVGVAVAVGLGVYDSRTGNHVPTRVSVGDEVLLPQNAHYETVKLDGDEYVICREVDLLAFRENQTPVNQDAIKDALKNTTGGIDDPVERENAFKGSDGQLYE